MCGSGTRRGRCAGNALVVNRPGLVRVYYAWRVDVRQVMLRFLRQVLCVPDPVAGFAGAGGFVVTQMLVRRFNELDALT